MYQPKLTSNEPNSARSALVELRRSVDMILVGDYAGAEQRLWALLRIHPDLPEAQHHLAVVLHARGQATAAVRHLEMALQLDPHLPGAVDRLARYRDDVAQDRAA